MFDLYITEDPSGKWQFFAFLQYTKRLNIVNNLPQFEQVSWTSFALGKVPGRPTSSAPRSNCSRSRQGRPACSPRRRHGRRMSCNTASPWWTEAALDCLQPGGIRWQYYFISELLGVVVRSEGSLSRGRGVWIPALYIGFTLLDFNMNQRWIIKLTKHW